MSFSSRRFLLSVLLLLPSQLLSATVDVLSLDKILRQPDVTKQVFPYVINLASLPTMLDGSAVKHFDKLGDRLIYYVKVKVDGVIYYRLSLGNFANRRLAQQGLGEINPYYPDAWIGKRSSLELESLRAKIIPVSKPVTAKPEILIAEEVFSAPKAKSAKQTAKSLAEKLSSQAKEQFLNEDYARVIKITDKLMEIGDEQQRQKALELAGLARERQRKFAQAIAIYEQFLDLYPDSELQPRITARLQAYKP